MIRTALSRTKRVRIFQMAEGKCHICGGQITVGEAWDIEHPIPLAMGGSDGEEALRPAHSKCHKQKTRNDVRDIARAKRRHAVAIGAKTSRNPLPGGKQSNWKRKLDGTVVRR